MLHVPPACCNNYIVFKPLLFSYSTVAPVAGTSVLAVELSALAADSSALAAYSLLAAGTSCMVYRPPLLSYSTAASVARPSFLAAGPPALAVLVADSSALAVCSPLIS